MDEIKTTRIFKPIFLVVLPEHNFGSGKDPILEILKKSELIRIN
jgi:hypothetical protein